MIRKLLLSLVWFPAASFLVLANLFLLQSLHIQEKRQMAYPDNSILSPLGERSPIHFSSSESTSQVLGSSVVSGDARGPLLRKFLESHDSPMAPYATTIVEESDKNGIDFRLVVSIAMCESNLGKRIPKDSYNAWGIAVYTGQNSGAMFRDWDHAITWVSKYMKERYIDKGYTTLREIGAIYAPPSVHTGHSWSNCVDSFQQSIF